METDRDASGQGELPTGPDPSPSAGSPHAPPAPPAEPASPATPGQDYSYGHTPLEAAGTGGLREADSGTGERPVAPGSAAGIDPATGMRTAPRAVLRPVPEGFPTPPPRPAVPNRRPAPKTEDEPAPATDRRRGLIIAGIALAAVLLLAVAVGGAILAVRALSPADRGAAPAPAAESEEAAPAADGEVAIGEITVSEVSTETGVRSVGDQGYALEPEGEYIVVTFEITNPSDTVVMVDDRIALETDDGQSHAPDSSASSAYVGKGADYGIVAAGETVVFHKVYDVPIGTSPTGLHFDFAELDETGTLPLGG